MSDYQRNYQPGGCYFFTVNLQNRQSSLLTDHIGLLRQAVFQCRQETPFIIHAWVVLPEHMHAIWSLPEEDANYSGRWRSIKKFFTRHLPDKENWPVNHRGERRIWQRRFWEHTIRDELDFKHHFDYVHYNPVKHGLVTQVSHWPYSTFHRAVQQGIYPHRWSL